jgi:hypothetical protein
MDRIYNRVVLQSMSFDLRPAQNSSCAHLLSTDVSIKASKDLNFRALMTQ